MVCRSARLGAVMQAGQRFEDPSQIDFLGLWEDVRKGAYNADAMLVENEEDKCGARCCSLARVYFGTVFRTANF